jgi:hypothetical protein
MPAHAPAAQVSMRRKSAVRRTQERADERQADERQARSRRGAKADRSQEAEVAACPWAVHPGPALLDPVAAETPAKAVQESAEPVREGGRSHTKPGVRGY